MSLSILTMIPRPDERAARSARPDAPTITPDRSSPLRRQLASVQRLLADRPELRRPRSRP